MSKLILSAIDSNRYRITGAVDELRANKRAKLLLKSKLSLSPNGEQIELECVLGIDYVADILKLAASYINATLEYDSEASQELAEFSEREENFKKFSKAAANIKENNCDASEFRYFTDILDKTMPARHLYPLQLLSAYHLAFSQNGCNFSVPGAGKTSIVYGAYTYLKNQGKDQLKHVDHIVIIGPLSSFGPWENEYEECFGRKAKSQRLTSNLSKEQKKQYFFESPKELTLISYASVVSVKDELIHFLRHNKTMVVLDEAHKIKNTSGGITAASIMELAKDCTSRVVLTGTPAPNGYEDLYNLFHFIWPQNDVIKYTVGQLREMSKSSSGQDNRIMKMMENVNPYFIRIRKSDLGLPPVVEHTPIRVPMEDSQRRIYDFIEQTFVEEVNHPSNSGIHSLLIKAKMIRLQQAATNPALLYLPLSSFSEETSEDLSIIDDNSIMREIMTFYDGIVPAKFNECLKLVRKIISSGENVVIWTIFIKNIEALSLYLNENGIQCRTLYGATPVADTTMDDEAYSQTREGIVKEFHNPDSSFKVIIANPFAVAESISLHKACHNAIYLERSFNCAHYLQSKDRIHRYGLPAGITTNYYYILSADSIDETIHTRLALKEQRMLEIIEQMPIPLFANVTDEGDDDIKAIMNDYVKRTARKEI